MTSQCLECNTTVKAPAEFSGASEDGSKVFFLTEQELFSGDTTKNLYEYDFDNRDERKIVRVSGGSETPEVQGVARVSENGSHVYFVAKGVLTTEPRGGGCVEKCLPAPGANNLYVFERDAANRGGRTAFIATLSSETEAELVKAKEACTGGEKVECEERAEQAFNQRNRADSADWYGSSVQSTPDGQFLVFDSVADLTPGDTSVEPQVFEYDALEGEAHTCLDRTGRLRRRERKRQRTRLAHTDPVDRRPSTDGCGD